MYLKKTATMLFTMMLVLTLLCPTVLAKASSAAEMRDLDSSKWYYQAADYVVKNGYMSGVSDTLFDPNGGVSRAMTVQTFYAIAGKPGSSSKGNFTDVKSSDWFCDAANWAAETGVAAGYPDGTFRPNTKVTREQLSVFFKAFAGYQDKNTVGRANIYLYDDCDNTSVYALSPMEWAIDSGIITGKTKSQLKPKDTATRAELAQMLYRYAPVEQYVITDENIDYEVNDRRTISMEIGDTYCIENADYEIPTSITILPWPSSASQTSTQGQTDSTTLRLLSEDKVEWESTNTKAITVKDGILKAVGIGGAEIYVVPEEGDYFSQFVCRVYSNGFAEHMVPDAYSELNAFRTMDGVWYWNEDNTTKTVFNTNNSNRLKALERNSALEETAKRRAREISVSASHTRPNGTDALSLFPPGVVTYGENIAGGFDSAQDVTNVWKEESSKYEGQGHRRNMLRPKYDSVGIACYYHNGSYLWVQDFAKMK